MDVGVLELCVCVCVCVWDSEWQRQPAGKWKRKYGSFEWGKKLIFFFYTDTEEEFLFLLYKNLSCRFDKISLSLFKHVRIAPCWVHPILSVEAVCAFAFSLGSEGITSDPLELHWALLLFRAFSFVLSGLTQPEGINPAKDLRKPSPFGLMIVWALGRWASEICTWPYENTSWRLPLRTLRHRLWDSPCSFSLTQSLCLWASRIVAMTSLINKNEWDVCDLIYPVKVFIIIVSDISRYGGFTSLPCCVYIITSYHQRRCFVFYGGHTSKIVEYLHMVLYLITWTPSPTIRLSVYVSMVHDDIYVVSFDCRIKNIIAWHLLFKKKII